jgi:hypothetical protein
MRRCLRIQALCLVFLLSVPAHAGQGQGIVRPDPLDPQAAVPALAYASPLAHYRPMSEPKVGAWKEANDRVARIGGWRAYAREAAQPVAPASAARGKP